MYQPRSGLGKSVELSGLKLAVTASLDGPAVEPPSVGGTGVVAPPPSPALGGLGSFGVVAPPVDPVPVDGAVVVEGDSITVVWLSTQQVFSAPTAGSPNIAFEQATPLAYARSVKADDVPYLTLRVPLNEHVPYSCAQTTQEDTSGSDA
ncbi:MAG: hypothetical protein HS128_09715 [Ideonella sp.]|nr:hypothetical protein [Ideonella sp.]